MDDRGAALSAIIEEAVHVDRLRRGSRRLVLGLLSEARLAMSGACPRPVKDVWPVRFQLGPQGRL